jgi:ABC-type multidrug transport system ATPase subunit
MIEAHQLTKRYGDKTAVEDLSFTVRPGIVTGFLGPNGAGKSTTMRMILGLDTPTSGSVTVNGRPYVDHRAPLRQVGALRDNAKRRDHSSAAAPQPPEIGPNPRQSAAIAAVSGTSA